MHRDNRVKYYSSIHINEKIKQSIPRITENESIEIEYKLQNCNQDLFIKLLKDIRKSIPEFELTQSSTAVYIENDGTRSARGNNNTQSYILQKIYNHVKNGKHKKDIINRYRKKQIATYNIEEIKDFRISISKERDLTEADKTTSTRYISRIKNRISFEMHPWRYDFTQSVQIDPAKSPNFNKDTIREYANTMFGNIANEKSPDKIFDAYIANCGNNIISRFELEIELIDAYKENYILHGTFLDAFSNSAKSIFLVQSILSQVVTTLGLQIRTYKYSIKSLLTNARSLSKNLYNEIYPPVGYYISYKADGERALLVRYDNETSFLIVTNELIALNGALSKTTNAITEIIEGEYLADKKIFLAYDILLSESYNGDSQVATYEKPFRDRLADLNGAIVKYIKDKTLAATIEIKKWYLITEDLQRSFKAPVDEGFKYVNDGFILSDSKNRYFDTKTFKIKKHNTIDFVIAKLPEIYLGKKPYICNDKSSKNIYILYSGINIAEMQKMLIEPLPFTDKLLKSSKVRTYIHFCPSDYPLAYIWCVDAKTESQIQDFMQRHNKQYAIAELLPPENANFSFPVPWKLIKFRDDRVDEPNYYGNDFLQNASQNWHISQNPVNIQDMHLPVVTYFNQGKNNIYLAQTSMNSFTKTELIKEASSPSERRVIDFAAGKGQDLFRYTNLGYERGLFLDIDKTALGELIARWYSVVTNRNKAINIKINTLHQDMLENHKQIISNIERTWGEDPLPNLIVCNFAIHYFTRTLEELINVIHVIDEFLSADGKFLYTTFNGKAVVDLVNNCGNGEEWIARENSIVKYHIKMKKGATCKGFGEMINLKLPFTDDMYEEHLVNIEIFNETFARRGYNIVKTGSFSDYFDLFENGNREMYKMLSDDDKKFISLYQYTIMQKAK